MAARYSHISNQVSRAAVCSSAYVCPQCNAALLLVVSLCALILRITQQFG